ncbi:type IX secretion system plug protein domain-containing protein [Aureivirga sp. CE67]|uniref:type IX secretion system plug protein n=1 Tax=Aureivirga sp. CE67 TaxID=1788983 RepID=UPI0018CB086A|nr:type IX secretion system plug protein domain-containing protein [Aureivirga sp. CE67]
MRSIKILCFGIIFLFFNTLQSQELLDTPLPENIRTVILRSMSTNQYTPIIKLGEKIRLSFDDLEADSKDYYYKITHCDFNWEPSNISTTEYLDGYTEDRIRNFEISFNTYQDYTHYQLTIPNNNMILLISGNYVITVMDEDENPLFEKRFIVYEPRVNVGVSVYKSRDVKYIDSKQNIQFTINHPGFNVNNPNIEIKTMILQNDDWNTAIKNLKPQYYRGSQLIYKYGKESTFWANNEFLWFDSKQIRIGTSNIHRSLRGEHDIFNTYLYVDKERKFQPYTYYPGIHGNFVIRTLDGEDPRIEADYSIVHFYLDTDGELDPNKRIYVSGAFNDWKHNYVNQMEFNAESGLYELKMEMKQGFYNYRYSVIDDNGLINNCEIDGSFYQTNNLYRVLVYYQQLGSRYTKVIGMGLTNSETFQN